MKINKKLIVMLILSVFLISTVVATAHAVSMPKTDKQLESKEKVAKVKVTFNANGGKIGSKKPIATSVKKGAKLNKLAATPKRSGYDFRGWYTKKSGGKKISENTKVSKKVTFYAHWKKKGSTRTNSKLVGLWERSTPNLDGSMTWRNQRFLFKKDGTFSHFLISSEVYSYDGKYSVSNGKIYFSNVVFRNDAYEVGYKRNEPNSWVEYMITTTSKGNEQLKLTNSGNSFTGSTWWYKYN